MTARYRFDPTRSRFTVQVFAGGLLAFLGHNPTFAILNFGGHLEPASGPTEYPRIWISVQAGSLELLDEVRPADRADIEGRLRREVLETQSHSTIEFAGAVTSASKVSENRHRLRIQGTLSLRGLKRSHQLEAELETRAEEIVLRGVDSLHLSEFGIAPVTALGGTLQVKDTLQLEFELVGVFQGSE